MTGWFLMTLGLGVSPAFAQLPETYASSRIQADLRRLQTLGSVLYIAAHPDDENTRLLSYLARERGYRTAYLSLTRGDGGQNLIGNEQGVELGVIRTAELMEARRLDGAEQYFTSAYDFGYSKTPQETLRIWDKDSLLREMVILIRRFRPDVVICRFPTTGEGGHGHHTASAILAREAVDAAADVSRYPETLTPQTPAWKVRRLMWNTFNFGSANTQREDQLKLDVGGYNTLLGLSYGEIASQSRSQHKSQGFGVPLQRGSSIEYFKFLSGEAPVQDLFDGVDTRWSRVPSLAAFSARLDELIRRFQPLSPDSSLPGLAELYNKLMPLCSSADPETAYWAGYVAAQIPSLLLRCGGWHMESLSREFRVPEGDSIRVSHQFISRSRFVPDAVRVSLEGRSTDLGRPAANILSVRADSFRLLAGHELSQPYWLQSDMGQGRFGRAGLDPEADSSVLMAKYECEIFQTRWTFRVPVLYKYTDPVKGERRYPAMVIPALYVEPEYTHVATGPKSHTKMQLTIKANRDLVVSSIGAQSPGIRGARECLRDSAWVLRKGEKRTLSVYVIPGYTLYQAWAEGRAYNQYVHPLEYDHIPRQGVLHKAEARRQTGFLDLPVKSRRIGYIEGAGDKVPEVLTLMGYQVERLQQQDITAATLARFDAVITGIRAYNTHEWLQEMYETLMEYVRNGGVMLVQYNTQNNLGPLKGRMAPFPLSVSRNRVTDETSPVVIVQPDHPLFQHPYKITAEDFNGWIQERSVYDAGPSDTGYVKMLRLQDPGEAVDEGSLLWTRYGKGVFMYTGLSLFRQLPAGVPGAYRLMINLIEGGKEAATR